MHQIDLTDLNFDFIEHQTQINNQVFDILVVEMNGLSLHCDIMSIFESPDDQCKQI